MHEPNTATHALERVSTIRAAIPEGGMFADRESLLSPEPFLLDKTTVRQLERLGDQLYRFQSACNDAYFRSHKGTLPKWIAELFDAGKPSWLTEHARTGPQRDALPQVLRPDLILTDDGFALTELDSVPGGIGLTGHLAQLYAQFEDHEIIGGADGMIEGFRTLLPDGGDILISDESGDYRPEMNWLAAQLGDGYEVHKAETYTPSDRPTYRFYELFDHASMPWLQKSVQSGTPLPSITPPLKPHLEEKLWLALFWSLPLREFWSRALRDKNFKALQEIIPFGWPVDPTPLPPHAALPHLNANSWDDVANFSQKERELVLKISGFSEQAWGSRGVHIGQDLPQTEWADTIAHAIDSFSTNPYVLQRFHPGKIIEHPYIDPKTGTLETMRGRVRLCPYYFIPPTQKRPTLAGVLATIVPADKKLVHGMSEAILVPCALA